MAVPSDVLEYVQPKVRQSDQLYYYWYISNSKTPYQYQYPSPADDTRMKSQSNIGYGSRTTHLHAASHSILSKV